MVSWIQDLVRFPPAVITLALMVMLGAAIVDARLQRDEHGRLVWKPNPGPQTEFLRRTEFEVLYGGAMGGGKSEALLAEALRYVHNPYARALLLRRTYPDLRKSLIDRSKELWSGMAVYNEGSHTWTFPSGAQVVFGHLQRESDVYNYQSAQFDYIGFDEATQFTEFQYSFMKTRVRSRHPEIRARVRLASNPGGVGHQWIKQRFIDPAPPGVPHQDPETGEWLVFIPARVSDNPWWQVIDPAYEARLRALPEIQRKMYLQGSWDVFTGQFFSEWDSRVHVVDPFRVPDGWRLYGSFDWGYSAPACYLLHAVAPDGSVYTIAEYYDARRSVSEVADEILRLEGGYEVEARFADPSIWARQIRRGDEPETTIADIFYANGVEFSRANNDRKMGWKLMHEALAWRGRGGQILNEPQWKIFSTCRNLIRTLPALVSRSTDPEDIEPGQEDHAADAARYGLMHILPSERGEWEYDRWDVALWRSELQAKQAKKHRLGRLGWMAA